MSVPDINRVITVPRASAIGMLHGVECDTVSRYKEFLLLDLWRKRTAMKALAAQTQVAAGQ